jgi:hypothetical protein
MQTAVIGRMAVFAAALAGAAPAMAIIVGGGGSQGKDCLVVFEASANFPLAVPKQVRCTDGDPSCDADGDVNGICSLPVKVCANSTFSSECTLNGVAQINVDHSFDNGNDAKFDPDFLAMRQRIEQDFSFPLTSVGVCTGTVNFRVPIKGPLGNNNSCARTRKKLKLRSVSTPASGAANDTDTLKLYCEPAPGNGCDPQTLFDGTFDRIQRQIFNQSCALGGCHDSESQMSGLLLETGAAYGNLINQTPVNASAANAGWLRVSVVPDVSGDPDTSFLLHKIEGDLPDGTYGSRMPLDKPKLNSTLRDIIQLWIEAGAPQTTWVPGTF